MFLNKKCFLNVVNFRCEIAAGNEIDKADKINTSGFYIELGTAQVCR